jgi:hypothetical protein
MSGGAGRKRIGALLNAGVAVVEDLPLMLIADAARADADQHVAGPRDRREGNVYNFHRARSDDL